MTRVSHSGFLQSCSKLHTSKKMNAPCKTMIPGLLRVISKSKQSREGQESASFREKQAHEDD
jgi:hypothetical protein